MKLSEFDYHLPQERIAQTPVEPRDASRLLVLNRETGELTHTHFFEIGQFLQPGDLLVVNRTRVMPARIYAQKVPTGGKVEILLLNRLDGDLWEALVGGKRVKAGTKLSIQDVVEVEVEKVFDGPRRLLRFSQPIDDLLEQIGQMPLPPYIHEKLQDPSRYQTVYADKLGSAAAPTAGLHFTPKLIASLKEMGIGMAEVTLHVGLDTFAPVTEEDVTEHHIHTEWCQLSAETANQINRTRAVGGKIVAVGTTSVRTLETAALYSPVHGPIQAFEGNTDLYILPGFQFRMVDAMVTNFHLPKSTLLMLVSAFSDLETILQAYQTAIERKYRFYSFGDAMLIL
ncbi:MAG: tRNA preQ1(34) S-adenosylmethionine ribosyltransferase-isomerase QueA [Anaerolineales bacterium]